MAQKLPGPKLFIRPCPIKSAAVTASSWMMSSRMSIQVTKDQVDASRIYVRFVNILYAVVIGQSFVLLTSKYAAWFEDWASYQAQIATILLVYALVVTSWVGYHRSVEAYPILQPYRFLLDIFLLFVYYVAFASNGDFGTVTRLFFIVFAAYTLWDLVRVMEYWNLTYETEDRMRLEERLGVSALFLFLVGILSYLYSFFSTNLFATAIFFVGMIALLALFRFVKRKYKTRVSLGRGRCDHLEAHYFTTGGSPNNPVGDRLLVNCRTKIAYHMGGDFDDLVSEQRIRWKTHYDKAEDEWCRQQGLRLEPRTPKANELF
jgi:succinate dehydrogenase hydrophobic anchor subunit